MGNKKGEDKEEKIEKEKEKGRNLQEMMGTV